MDAVDSFQPPTRDFSKPLIMPICDVIKSPSQGQVSACGKLEAGAVRSGSKVCNFFGGEVPFSGDYILPPISCKSC